MINYLWLQLNSAQFICSCNVTGFPIKKFKKRSHWSTRHTPGIGVRWIGRNSPSPITCPHAPWDEFPLICSRWHDPIFFNTIGYLMRRVFPKRQTPQFTIIREHISAFSDLNGRLIVWHLLNYGRFAATDCQQNLSNCRSHLIGQRIQNCLFTKLIYAKNCGLHSNVLTFYPNSGKESKHSPYSMHVHLRWSAVQLLFSWLTICSLEMWTRQGQRLQVHVLPNPYFYIIVDDL